MLRHDELVNQVVQVMHKYAAQTASDSGHNDLWHENFETAAKEIVGDMLRLVRVNQR